MSGCFIIFLVCSVISASYCTKFTFQFLYLFLAHNISVVTKSISCEVCDALLNMLISSFNWLKTLFQNLINLKPYALTFIVCMSRWHRNTMWWSGSLGQFRIKVKWKIKKKIVLKKMGQMTDYKSLVLTMYYQLSSKLKLKYGHNSWHDAR